MREIRLSGLTRGTRRESGPYSTVRCWVPRRSVQSARGFVLERRLKSKRAVCGFSDEGRPAGAVEELPQRSHEGVTLGAVLKSNDVKETIGSWWRRSSHVTG